MDGQFHYGYATEQEASAAVIQRFHQRQRNLQQEPLDDISDNQLRRWLQVFMSIYRHHVPGDVECGRRLYNQHAAMFEAEPALLVLWIQGKTQPWRETLYSTWSDMESRGSRGLGLNYALRGQLIFTVIQQTLAALSKVDAATLQLWADHTGRHNKHHSVFLAMALKLKILRKVVTSEPNGKMHKYGTREPQTYYELTRRSQEVEKSLALLAGGSSVLRRHLPPTIHS
jgi:hypothetical protein